MFYSLKAMTRVAIFATLLAVSLLACGRGERSVESSKPSASNVEQQANKTTTTKSGQQIDTLFEELRQQETSLRAREQTLEKISQELETRNTQLNEKEHQLRNKEIELVERQAGLEKREASVRTLSWLSVGVSGIGLFMMVGAILLWRKVRRRGAPKKAAAAKTEKKDSSRTKAAPTSKHKTNAKA